MCHWCHCVIDVTVCHWCHPVMMSLSLTSLWITDVTDASMSLMSLCDCGSLMSLCHWCHCVTGVTVCHWCHYVIDVTVSLMSLYHWCHYVTMSAAPYKSLFCSYHIFMSSVIYLSDEGLTLETSALKLFSWPIYVINSVDDPKLPYYTLQLTQHHSFFRNVPPLLLNSCTATCNRFDTCNMEMKQFFPFI